MLRRGWAASIHARLSSVDEASSFFEKVQLHFQLADLFVEFVFLGIGLLADLLAAVAEDVGQASQRLFLPAPDLGRVDAEHLRDLGRRLVRLDGLHGHLGLQAWVGDSYGFWALTLLHFQCRPLSKKSPFLCPENQDHFKVPGRTRIARSEEHTSE